MIVDHLLRELFNFGILGFLESELAQLNFRLVLAEQAIGQEMINHLLVSPSRGMCRSKICLALVGAGVSWISG